MSADLDSLKLGPRRYLGLRPMANSMGVLPLEVIEVFLTVAFLRIIWAREWPGPDSLKLSTRAKRNFSNSRTLISAQSVHGLRGPSGKTYQHKSTSDEVCKLLLLEKLTLTWIGCQME